jgi:hypothetical protein
MNPLFFVAVKKVKTNPYFIGFTTTYDEPCFHVPVIVRNSYLYNLINKI